MYVQYFKINFIILFVFYLVETSALHIIKYRSMYYIYVYIDNVKIDSHVKSFAFLNGTQLTHGTVFLIHDNRNVKHRTR